MRIEISNFSFETPPGFVDWTNYTFKNRNDTQVLTVTSGKKPRDAQNLQSLLASRKQELQDLISGPLVIEAESESLIAQWPARLLVFTFVDRKETYREHWAVAFDTPDTYTQISYAASSKDTEASSRFNHILHSVTSSEIPKRGGGQDDFVPQWAGLFYLNVPANLAPPRTYQFSTQDDSGHLLLTYYDPRDSSRPEPTLEKEVAEDGLKGAVSAKVSATFSNGDMLGESIAYLMDSETPDGNERVACRRVILQQGDRVRIHLYARSKVEQASNLEQFMTRWISTFKFTR